MKKELTVTEWKMSNFIFQNPNIKQAELANHFGSRRKVRELVNSIRNKGWQVFGEKVMFLIADDNGYNWEEPNSPRAIRWREKTLKQSNELQKLILSFDR